MEVFLFAAFNDPVASGSTAYPVRSPVTTWRAAEKVTCLTTFFVEAGCAEK